MNIEEFRALKAKQESESKKEQPEAKEETVVNPNEEVQEEVKEETKEEKIEEKEVKQETKPSAVKLGDKEYSLDEVEEWRKGYLRNSDYTRKTQEVAKMRKEYDEAIRVFEEMKKNPPNAQQGAEAQQGKIPQFLQTPQKKILELEQKLTDLVIQLEVKDLEAKYPDFDAKTVTEYAEKEGISSLEKAYKLHLLDYPAKKEEVDVDKLRAQIKEELLKELQEEKEGTRTTISSKSSNKKPVATGPQLSPSEAKIAKAFGMGEKEYIEYKSNLNKK